MLNEELQKKKTELEREIGGLELKLKPLEEEIKQKREMRQHIDRVLQLMEGGASAPVCRVNGKPVDADGWLLTANGVRDARAKQPYDPEKRPLAPERAHGTIPSVKRGTWSDICRKEGWPVNGNSAHRVVKSRDLKLHTSILHYCDYDGRQYP
jgi:3-mercaptopyruvate sulfurtransferase SseA